MSTSRFWMPKLASQQKMYSIFFSANQSASAEGAAERAAAVGLPQADPALVGIGGHDRVEGAFQERRGNFVEVAHAVGVGVAHERAVGVDHADAGQRRPALAVGEGFEQLQEGDLALVVHGEVDLRVGPHEGFGLVGHVRAAKQDHDARLQFLQPPGNLERDAAVPDVGAEADNVGVLELLDRIGDTHALVERRQEVVTLGMGRELLHIGLQQRNRVRQVVLARERVVDLDQADFQLRGVGCVGRRHFRSA
jgi:hypothetical protein